MSGTGSGLKISIPSELSGVCKPASPNCVQSTYNSDNSRPLTLRSIGLYPPAKLLISDLAKPKCRPIPYGQLFAVLCSVFYKQKEKGRVSIPQAFSSSRSFPDSNPARLMVPASPRLAVYYGSVYHRRRHGQRPRLELIAKAVNPIKPDIRANHAQIRWVHVVDATVIAVDDRHVITSKQIGKPCGKRRKPQGLPYENGIRKAAQVGRPPTISIYHMKNVKKSHESRI